MKERNKEVNGEVKMQRETSMQEKGRIDSKKENMFVGGGVRISTKTSIVNNSSGNIVNHNNNCNI